MDGASSAAANNAQWCAAVWHAHGLAAEQSSGAWFTRGAAPRFYPNAVTVDRHASTADQVDLALSLSADLPVCALKDSFAVLPLERSGFRSIVEARWFWRERTDPILRDPRASSSRVSTTEGFDAWVDAWCRLGGGEAGILLPGLLTHPGAELWATYRDDRSICAGVAVFRAADVVGLTNMFGSQRALLAAIAATSPEPLVGYTADPSWATKHGFQILGPLTVWECHRY